MGLRIEPVSNGVAKGLVRKWHRKLPVCGPPNRTLFSLVCLDAGRPCGVLVACWPSARHIDDGTTLEVSRVATDGTRNACSKLYGAAAQAARAMGFRRVVTYTLREESGSSMRAVGWRMEEDARGGSRWGAGSPRLLKWRWVHGPQGSEQSWARVEAGKGGAFWEDDTAEQLGLGLNGGQRG